MSWIDSASWKPVVVPDPVCDAGHVCLAGPMVSADWALIAALKRRHQVTVTESALMLQGNPLLSSSIDVLALECAGDMKVAETVRRLRAWQPELCIVLVGEAMSQNEIAEAFREGALDFFADPTDAELLAERVHSLCRRYRRTHAHQRSAGADAVS